MAEYEDVTTVVLPSVLDLKSVGPLHQTFLSARGTPIDVNAAEVTRLGGLGIDVIAEFSSARRSSSGELTGRYHLNRPRSP